MGVSLANEALLAGVAAVELAAPDYGHPSEDLYVIGVTGTDRKSVV